MTTTEELNYKLEFTFGTKEYYVHKVNMGNEYRYVFMQRMPHRSIQITDFMKKDEIRAFVNGYILSFSHRQYNESILKKQAKFDTLDELTEEVVKRETPIKLKAVKVDAMFIRAALDIYFDRFHHSTDITQFDGFYFCGNHSDMDDFIKVLERIDAKFEVYVEKLEEDES